MIDNDIKKLSGMRRLLYFSILLCTTSCQKHENTYYPLYAGLAWQYHIEKQTAHGLLKQKEIINNLGTDKTVADNTFIRASINGIESHYIKSSTGINLQYRVIPGKIPVKKDDIPATVFSYPLIVGTQWQDNIRTSLLRSYDFRAEAVIESIPVTVTVTIESITDTVRVPAGKYLNYMRIVSVGEKHIQKGTYAYQAAMNISIKNTRWYAVGVGLVKELQLESTDILQYPAGSYSKTLSKFYQTQ